MTGAIAHPALRRVVDGLAPIPLAEVVDTAALTRRFDHKFLVAVERLPALLDALDGMRVLEVGGRRATPYTSVYLDTPDLRSYRDHAQRRRRRWKLRTRDYADGAGPMLELKLKGRRALTIKERWRHPHTDPTALGPDGRALVEDALARHYAVPLPDRLQPSATTRYTRFTLVDDLAGERVTIDLDLTVERNGRRLELGTAYAVVETKTPARRGTSVEALRALGERPRRLSKYCVGVAAADDRLRGNPWMPALRLLLADQVRVAESYPRAIDAGAADTPTDAWSAPSPGGTVASAGR